MSQPTTDGTIEVLGLWRATPPAVSIFDAAAPSVAAWLWRADLPAGRGRAAEALSRDEATTAALGCALDDARARLSRFVADARSGVAFEAGPALAPPEAQLARALAELGSTDGAASFFPGEGLVEEVSRAGQQFEIYLEQLTQLMLNYAIVETRIEGVPLGRTRVDWTGDTATVWRARLDPGQAGLHRRDLALALARRALLIRMVAVTVPGAIRLSMPLASPGTALLGLPLAWRFVNQVLTEWRRYQAAKEVTSA